MRTLSLPLTAVLAFVCVPQEPAKQDPVPAPAPATVTPAPIDPARIQELAWISGTWTLRLPGRTTEEHWRPLQGTTILGSSHTYDDKRTMFFEHLRIQVVRDRIGYVAMPGGAAPTVFLLTKLENGVAEFENGKHDAPQRIRYEKTEKGITATISQLDGSKKQTFAFTKE